MKRLMALVVSVIIVLAAMPARADEEWKNTREKNFTMWFDAGQPSVVSYDGHKYLGGAEWLVLGVNFSACRVGRLRSCSLGLGWGVLRLGADRWGNNHWGSTLLITSPQTIRLNDPGYDSGDPEVDFAVTPFYNATHQHWGVMVGFTIGG